jgi:NAD-dependent deacetylase
MNISQDLIQLLRNSKRVVVLTGAGVSKESGMPTFREAQTGLWAKYDPMELATPQAFQGNPKLVWEWYQWRRGLASEAKPNPGHFALVEMETNTSEFVLITQNIDGLHRRAGSKNIIELHGNIFRNKCFNEETLIEEVEGSNDFLPRCPDCGGLVRPDVVWFGENLPPEALDKALQAAQTADAFLSVGTSSFVQPAASFPLIALESGAVIIEINPDKTQLSQKAHYSIKGPSGVVLPQLINNVWNSP